MQVQKNDLKKNKYIAKQQVQNVLIMQWDEI